MANYTREKRARLNAFLAVPWKQLSRAQRHEFMMEFTKHALKRKFNLVKRPVIKTQSNENI
jgi:hypothetical protein